MTHHASSRFWKTYRRLPSEICALADRNHALLKDDPTHAPLHFKKVGGLWSVRVGLHYRALATEIDGDLVWFWIGSHAEHDTLLGHKPAHKRSPTSRAKRKAPSQGR